MGNTVEWSDFVSFRNIFLTHNFCIIIIIIGHLQNFALLILVAILPAASFQVAKLLRTVDPLLHIGSISVPLPSSSSSFQDVRRLKANFHSWPTVGPHLTGLTYFPWLAARINAIVIIILRQIRKFQFLSNTDSRLTGFTFFPSWHHHLNFSCQKKQIQFCPGQHRVEAPPHLTRLTYFPLLAAPAFTSSPSIRFVKPSSKLA